MIDLRKFHLTLVVATGRVFLANDFKFDETVGGKSDLLKNSNGNGIRKRVGRFIIGRQ